MRRRCFHRPTRIGKELRRHRNRLSPSALSSLAIPLLGCGGRDLLGETRVIEAVIQNSVRRGAEKAAAAPSRARGRRPRRQEGKAAKGGGKKKHKQAELSATAAANCRTAVLLTAAPLASFTELRDAWLCGGVQGTRRLRSCGGDGDEIDGDAGVRHARLRGRRGARAAAGAPDSGAGAGGTADTARAARPGAPARVVLPAPPSSPRVAEASWARGAPTRNARRPG